MSSVAEASQRRQDRVLFEELDKRIDLLLASTGENPADRFHRVTSNPRTMGYLRFLLRHYAKSPTPWTDCFVETTPIATENGYLPIAEVTEGDLVWSYNTATQSFELKPVLAAEKVRADARVLKLMLDDGSELLATPNHRFLLRDGTWRRLGNISIGDLLLGGGTFAALQLTDLAVTNAGARPSLKKSSMFGPKMSICAHDFSASLNSSEFGLFSSVSVKSLVDCDLPAARHQWFDHSHDWFGGATVDSEVMSTTMLVGRESYVSTGEDLHESIERFPFLLCRAQDECGRPHTTSGSLASVVPEATFAFEKTSSPMQVCEREVFGLEFVETRHDVWDLEVADNHTFVAASIVVHNCYKDNFRRFGPKTAGLCGVLKDAIRQRANWRHGAPAGPHPGHPDVGSPGVAIGEADKWASPGWGGHGGHHLSEERPLSLLDELDLEFGVNDHTEPIKDAAEVLIALGEECDIYRVLIGLDEPPTFAAKEDE